MNKLGYTEEEVYLMQMGKWLDLYEVHKGVYNFEKAGMRYNIGQPEEEEEYGSAFDL